MALNQRLRAQRLTVVKYAYQCTTDLVFTPPIIENLDVPFIHRYFTIHVSLFAKTFIAYICSGWMAWYLLTVQIHGVRVGNEKPSDSNAVCLLTGNLIEGSED